MNVNSAPVQSLAARWRQEHVELSQSVDRTRRWTREVCQRGVPKFGEMAQHVRVLRERLVHHFECEDELCHEMSFAIDRTSHAVEATRRQCDRDHSQLLEQIDHLIEQLRQLEPPFESWTDGVRQLERILDALDFHEEQEDETLACLCPPADRLY